MQHYKVIHSKNNKTHFVVNVKTGKAILETENLTTAEQKAKNLNEWGQ